MALVIDNRRRREKSSTVPGEKPTIPPSEDHTDLTWVVTDIHEREIFINIPDGIVYTRIGTDIIEINTPDGIVSGLTLANGSDAVHFDVAQGFVKVNGLLLDHTSALDEAMIGDGDVTDPRIDLVTIDEANAIVVVAGTPAPNPVAPSLPANSVIVDIIVVPANHLAGSTAFLTFGLGAYNERFNRFKNWVALSPYEKGSIVIRNQEWYRALNTHVSSADFTTDYVGAGALPPKWETLGTPTGIDDEWQASVNSVETDPSLAPVSTSVFGDRFLIGAGAVGIWSTKAGQIAEKRETNFRYVTPTEGMSVKVDNDLNKIYSQNVPYVGGVFSWTIIVIGTGNETLADTLVLGNITGGTDIAMSAGDSIITAGGGKGQIDFNKFAIDGLYLTADGGSGSVGGTLGLYGGATTIKAEFYSDGTAAFTVHDTYVDANNSHTVGVKLVSHTHSHSRWGAEVGTVKEGLILADNSITTITSVDVANDSAIFNSRNSTITSAMVNTVTLGGDGITATKDNSAYANQFIILPSGGAFETILVPDGAVSQENTVTFQDASGTVAYLTDIAASDLASTLTIGNTTLDGQTIDALNGGGQIDLRNGGDDTVNLTTDSGANGEASLYLTPAYAELANYSFGQGWSAHYVFNQATKADVVGMVMDGGAYGIEIIQEHATQDNQITGGIFMKDTDLSALTSPVSTAKVGVLLNAPNSSIAIDVTGSVVIGGSGINVVVNDEVGMPNARLTGELRLDTGDTLTPVGFSYFPNSVAEALRLISINTDGSMSHTNAAAAADAMEFRNDFGFGSGIGLKLTNTAASAIAKTSILEFNLRNSATTVTAFGSITNRIINNVAASEDAELIMSVMKAGAFTDVAKFTPSGLAFDSAVSTRVMYDSSSNVTIEFDKGGLNDILFTTDSGQKLKSGMLLDDAIVDIFSLGIITAEAPIESAFGVYRPGAETIGNFTGVGFYLDNDAQAKTNYASMGGIIEDPTVAGGVSGGLSFNTVLNDVSTSKLSLSSKGYWTHNPVTSSTIIATPTFAFTTSWESDAGVNTSPIGASAFQMTMSGTSGMSAGQNACGQKQILVIDTSGNLPSNSIGASGQVQTKDTTILDVSGSAIGVRGEFQHDGTAGLVADAIGVRGSLDVNGIGDIDKMSALHALTDIDSATIFPIVNGLLVTADLALAKVTDYRGIYVETPSVSINITTQYGIYVDDQVNATGTAYGLWIEGASDYSVYVNSGDSVFKGNMGIGVTSWGTGAANTLAVGSAATQPSTTSQADSFQMYSFDIVAGNSCPHFLTENLDVIKLFTGASLTAAGGAVFSTGGAATLTTGDSDELDNMRTRIAELEERLNDNGLLA